MAKLSDKFPEAKALSHPILHNFWWHTENQTNISLDKKNVQKIDVIFVQIDNPNQQLVDKSQQWKNKSNEWKMFRVNNKVPERHQWRRSGFFTVNFEKIS